ncbi:hypothetical protein BSYN_13040 [Bacteroides sedimenti]|uniref:DUF3575 domain-containing protein n=1 Tax=Bacteroides sedimenti TaxID=2136147 RepID=A0ABM8IFF5_9BACE
MRIKLLSLFYALTVSIAIYSQNLTIKNNLLYDATTTPNLALEIGLGKKTTLDLYGGLNPFTYNDNKKLKHWLVQPELRFWNCERFNGLFFGIHAHGGQFNVGGIEFPFNIFPEVKEHRFEGYFYGGGVSVGNQWILNKHWNLEASIGGGYARTHYDKYVCPKCGPKVNSGNKNYWGVTKATLSLIYTIH